MPSYLVTCHGGLSTRLGLKPVGSVVEMSEKDAASLPVGTVGQKLAEIKPMDVKPTPKPEAKASKEKP